MKLVEKKYGFWTLTFLVVANMVGAGVFTTSGFSLDELDSGQAVMAAWFVGGLIALAGAYSYGQLSRLMPESGGEYLFLSRAVHPLLGFIAGWVSIIAGFSGAIAFAATTLEAYLMPQPSALPEDAVAVSSIIVAALLHGWSRQIGAATQNLVVLLKLGLLTVFVALALRQVGGPIWPAGAIADAPTSWPALGVFAGSLVWISLSYSGFNAAVYVADEVESPTKVIPRAMMVGTILVTLLYLALNCVFLSAPAEMIRGVPDVAAVAARHLGGASFEAFIRLTISLALLTSVFSMIMAAPRVYAKMADDGLMPAFLRFQRSTPRSAIVTQVVLAVVLVLMTDLKNLLDYVSMTLWISAAATVACLLLPSVRSRPLLHPAHLPPAVFVVSSLTSACLQAGDDPYTILAALLTFGVGVAIYFMTNPPRIDRPTAAKPK